MTEIRVGGHAQHGTHSGPTFILHRFGLHRVALHRFGLHRFGLHCLRLRLWPLVLLPPFRRFRFSRLHVLFNAPPLPLLLPLLLHLDVRLRLRLQNPLLGLELMVVFVGVVLVVEVMVVAVVVRDPAREIGVPKREWRTQLGCAPSFPAICCHLQRKHTER